MVPLMRTESFASRAYCGFHAFTIRPRGLMCLLLSLHVHHKLHVFPMSFMSLLRRLHVEYQLHISITSFVCLL